MNRRVSGQNLEDAVSENNLARGGLDDFPKDIIKVVLGMLPNSHRFISRGATYGRRQTGGRAIAIAMTAVASSEHHHWRVTIPRVIICSKKLGAYNNISAEGGGRISIPCNLCRSSDSPWIKNESTEMESNWKDTLEYWSRDGSPRAATLDLMLADLGRDDDNIY